MLQLVSSNGEERKSILGDRALRGNQAYVSRMVDYNLSNIHASGLEYFKTFFPNLLKTIIQVDEEYLTEKYYFRAENEVTRCNPKELMELIQLINIEIDNRFVQGSKDFKYYQFVKSLALNGLPKLKIVS